MIINHEKHCLVWWYWKLYYLELYVKISHEHALTYTTVHALLELALTKGSGLSLTTGLA
jgi:hypothetical protein